MLTFDWWRALFGRYDVFHVHWPENLQRGSNWWRTLVRQALTATLMLRLAGTRTPVVRTLHNTQPHEPGGFLERALLDWCDRRTSAWIRLNPTTAVPRPGPVRTILHSHYRDWYKDLGHDGSEPGRLLFFGLLRPYKGIEELLRAFGAADDPGLRLVIAGRPMDAGLRDQIEDMERQDPRVTARLEYLDDTQLADEISRAELIVLPYRRLHNSAAALLALSLNRPVLLPEGAEAGSLAAEVGSGWVRTFTPPLDREDLTSALDSLAEWSPTSRPDLSARDWEEAAAAHVALFRSVADRKAPGGL